MLIWYVISFVTFSGYQSVYFTSSVACERAEKTLLTVPDITIIENCHPVTKSIRRIT